MIQTGSLIYELFEWLLTIVMTAEEADYYNGQQGDMWDAQKDMAWHCLALLECSLYMRFVALLEGANRTNRDERLRRSIGLLGIK